MVYPALLPLKRTPRLPVVDWTDAPRRFKWTRPFRRKTKSGFCACAITFQTQDTSLGSYMKTNSFRVSYECKGTSMICTACMHHTVSPSTKTKFWVKWYRPIDTNTVRYSLYKYNIQCFLLAVKLYNVMKVVLREITLEKQRRHKSGTLNLVFISVINQFDVKDFCFTKSLFHASTCFEHMWSSSGGQNCITQPLVSSHL